MLSRLRGPGGEPATRVRVAAGLVVAGLVLGTAPVILLPVARALARLFASL